MLRRSFATLGFVALTLGACHSNSPPGNSMPDNPMYPGGMNYRVGSAARGNHSAMEPMKMIVPRRFLRIEGRRAWVSRTGPK